MQEFFRSKLATSLIVIATVILAGVAIFTAIRLYQLRQESISPTGPEETQAWDCSGYKFSINTSGTITVTNDTSRNEPAQQAKVYIEGQLVATFDVPALTTGQSSILGTTGIPTGSFSWRIVGTIDCLSAGSGGQEPISCTSLAFNFTEPSTTPTATSTPTNTPTSTPTGTDSVTPTEPPDDEPTPTTVTSTPTTVTSTPTTGGEISAASPTPGGAALPDAGISTPTLIAGLAGFLLILFALLLAL